jgi:hypothetical protein
MGPVGALIRAAGEVFEHGGLAEMTIAEREGLGNRERRQERKKGGGAEG